LESGGAESCNLDEVIAIANPELFFFSLAFLFPWTG